MRRTVINTLSLMVLFSSFVFAKTGKEAELQKPIKSFNGLTRTIRTQIFSDDFSYSDGSLIGNGSWVHYSGTTDGQVQVSNGTVLLNDSDTEDVRAQFAPVTSGMLYFGIDVTLADPGSYTGFDFEYFVGFSDTSSYAMLGRVDAAALSATGWSPGIANGSGAADATWASELNYATTYRIVVGTDLSTASSDLWVDPASSSDTKISGTGVPSFTQLSGVFFRQSSASPDLSYTLDNLVVSDTFSDVITTTSTPTSGDFTVVLTDSPYNDGWDGAYMDVSVNGTVVLSAITVASGASPTTYTFSVEDGDLVETAYTSGSWESEHSYEFFDNFGNSVAQDGPSPGTGISFTADVLVLSGDFTVVLTDSPYNDGWDGAYMDVSVNGTVVLSAITVASGASPTTYTFSVEDGDLVETAYTSGSWESEHSYAFYDNLGNSVAQDGPSPGAGISFTADVLEPPANPIIAINYTAVNHGTIVVGDTASFGDVFTVTNDGGGTMTITSVTDLTGTDYITTFDASISLAAGESHSFGFSYIPSDVGVDNVTFTVSSNGGDADIALSGAGYGTDYVNEGFEGGVPPAGWEANIVSGSYNWEQSSYWGSFDPGGTGSYTALYNTFSASTGSSAEMITPRLDFTGSASNILSFLYVGTGDALNIDISDDGGTTWYDVADITDHTNYYVVPYTYDLSAYTGNNVIIKFTALSAYRYRMAMDEVKFPPVYVPPSAPIYISEIVVTPTAGEFVEIFNPNASDVELSDYYLTDATYAGGGSYYYNIVTGSDYGGGSFGDFHARFPDGAIIAAGNYQTIALAGSDGFNAEYGIAPDYELYEDATVADSIPDMREAVTGSIGGQGGLTNGDEVVVLYFWDGLTDLVKDSDYLLWDNGGEVPNEAVDKTGVKVEGPDTDSDSSAYLDDTPIADQHFGPSPGYGFSLHRIDYGEGSETSTGGNGIDGHDETSENTDTTFALSLPTPGGAAQLDFFEPNNSLATAVSVSAPDTLTGMAINPVDDLDWFSFSADRWSKVTIDMFINGYSSLDGEIALFDEDSTKLVSADGGASGGDEQIADFEILTTGTYYIVAGYWLDVRASTGDYALGVAVTPAPSTGFVAGMVSDSETGLAIDSTAVISAYGVVYSGADGAYVFEAPIGLLDVSFTKDGYNSVFFAVSVDSGDTVDLNVVLTPEVVDNLYSTGFETGDDTGTSTVYSGWDFAVLDSMFNADGDTVLPDAGVYMLAYPDTAGVTYNNNDLVVWLSDSVIDISSFSSLQLSLDAIYDTESNWDYFYVGLLLDDGSIYYGSGGAITGSSTGWEELNLDVSWAIGASTTATPAIWFDSDASVNNYWGGAFDNITLTGNEFFLAPPTDLMAENYGASVPLSWDAPASAGRVAYELHRVDLANIHTLTRPMVIDENGQMIELVKGPRDYEQLTVDYQYSASSTRSLSHYNIFRADWPFGEYALLDTSTTNSYNDADVEDGDYVDYYVTAVYDEGTAMGSNEISARAGLPVVLTDDAYGGEDFEGGFAFENWEQFNSTSAAQWVVGDSAAADTSDAFGAGGLPPPAHTNFVYVSDGRAGGSDFESFLISPFLDFSDNHTAVVKLAGYAQVYANSNYTPCYVMVRADMGPWELLIDFSFDHLSGWGDYSASMDDVAGSDYVQLAVTYGHLGGSNSGYGNGIAIDDLTLDIIPGPHGLALAPTISDITLSWMHPDSTMANFSGPAIREISDVIAEKEQLSTLEIAQDRDDCFNQMGAIAFFWSFYDSLSGPASLFTFNPGPMIVDELEIGTYVPASAEIGGLPAVGQDISLAWVLAMADDAGVTVDTLAHGVHTFTAILSSSSETIAVGGVSANITDSTFLKVYYRPMTFADSVGGGGIVSAYLPAPLSDDGLSPTGLSGTDSAGVFYPSDYNFDLAVCGTPTPPAISYNVYKDGIVVDEGLEENTWTDDNVSVVTEYCYWVTGIVPMSFDMGMTSIVDGLVETEPTNVECGRAINQPPSDFTLLTPNDGDTVMISLDNIGGNQLFAWNASVDPNGSPVEYEICYNIVAPFDQFCDAGITSTAQFVPLQDIVDYIDSLQQAGHGYTVDITWQVYASDGMDETEAGNGPRTITFDAGYALGVGDELGVPDVFALHQNYPNPFNPVTTIRFDIPQESHVRMDVYNVMGQRVRTLMNGTMQPGFHAVRWDGTNDMGKPLASGMYIYRIQSSKFNSVKKLVLMK